MQFHHSVLSETLTSTGTWDTHDLIGFDGARVSAEDSAVLGVALSPNTVAGDPAAVMLLGIVRVKSSGAITAGNRVIAAASGSAVKAATAQAVVDHVLTGSANAFATALTTAADGEFVTILIR